MRCKPVDGKAWTTVRVRELRERLGIDAFHPVLQPGRDDQRRRHVTRLGICIGSVHKLIRKGVLPTAQLMPSTPGRSRSPRSKPRPSREAHAKSAAGQSFTNVSSAIRLSGSPASDRKMLYVAKLPRLLRKMNTWPLNGSAPMICCTLAGRPSNPRADRSAGRREKPSFPATNRSSGPHSADSTQPIQRRRWYEAVGRPRRDRRQPGQHQPGHGQAARHLSACRTGVWLSEEPDGTRP
jgi:hypothetical protein